MNPVHDFNCGVGNQGYVVDEGAIERFLETGQGRILQSAPIQDSGKGKDYFAFEIERKIMGSIRPPHWQGIGDCVSHGITGAAEDLQWIQKALNPQYIFRWLASEVLYGLARIQIGQGGCGYGDGAVVTWGIEAGQKFGFLPRDKYGNIDLTVYSSALAKRFGTPRVGAPTDLAQMATQWPLKEAHLITTGSGGASMYEQARDALASGGTVVTGSNQLYANSRDSQGFCRRGGRGGHCTYYRGFTDGAKRPGIAYQQSWGPDVPTGGSQTVTLESGLVITLPPGCFFIDASEFDRMHSGGDSEVWVLTSEAGFLPPKQSLAA